MDNPSQTSQRIRPILRAMERSIEDARRRRGGEPSPSVGAAATGNINAPATPPTHSQPSSTPAASAKPLHAAPQPPLQPIRPATSPSLDQPSAGTREGEVDPQQPPRLKARPKRWLSASA